MFTAAIGAKEVIPQLSRLRGAFFGALVSDALCLGSHYEYDAPTIKTAYGGRIETYMGPGEQLGGTTHGVGWGRRNYRIQDVSVTSVVEKVENALLKVSENIYSASKDERTDGFALPYGLVFLSMFTATIGAAKLEVTQLSRLRGAFFGTLVSDALCLGSHYEYDAPTIKKAYGGRIETYMGPGEKLGGTTHGVGWGRRNYHPGQKKGDQTDYGEYNILMLEFLAGRQDMSSPIQLSKLIPVWKARVSNNWGAWLCSQTKQTLQQVAQGVPNSKLGGNSNAMSVRSAAALSAFQSEEEVAAAATYGGRIETYMGPGEQLGGTTHGVGWGRRNYHPGQKKGDQTDYGEYNILMLEFLAGRQDKSSAILLSELIPVWQARVSNNWGAWLCTQTKQAAQQVGQGVPYDKLGGNSNAMAMRSAAALSAFQSEEEVAAAARTMMFTHRSEEALIGGEFFTRVAWKVIHQNLNPRDAITATAKESSRWIQTQVQKGFDKFKEATDPSQPLFEEEFADDLAMTSMARLWDVGKTEPIKVGKASPTEGTLPSSVYIILKYMESFEDAAKANAGEFFTRVAWKVIHQNLNPRDAITATAKESSRWIQTQVQKGFDKFEEATDPSRPLFKEEFADDLAMTSMARLWDVGKTEPIKVGKASPTEGTLPSSVYIILKYMESFEDAAKANAMVGGDNASRAVAIGMVLGAYHGVEGIPANLREELNAWEKCDALLEKLPLISALSQRNEL
eukprot:CAMPEP_0198229476 /NCGR_PEP_ID=MMETSP1445-20131203/114142_1 /TAXON_ID=36898 /ORGANISM="Pyramimonas sp., Strain CCMP2087" /LENGTH=736 /DNA_ID=CAMNT_0043909939 /DNA_START=135 /DNA_END=2346 /DNA_ORIENTATION=-